MILLDGKNLAAKCKARIRSEAEQLSRCPGLAVILVGDDPASRTYVNGKKKDCTECGFYSEEYTLPESTSQAELLELVKILNSRDDIDGILVQLPLPKHIEQTAILQAILPDKDVDCFHPQNIGNMFIGEPTFLPCTPAGVMSILDEYSIEPSGKRAVVLGRSNIVGKPMALLLLHRNATVTICHSKTPNLAEICQEADILISAVGKTKLITANMVKEGATVIDVAMNRDENGKLCGDVDFQAVAQKADYITPVPGGVGPMTRAALMENTLRSAKKHQGI